MRWKWVSLTVAAVAQDAFQHLNALGRQSVKVWVGFRCGEIGVVSMCEGAGAEAGVVKVGGEGCVAGGD